MIDKPATRIAIIGGGLSGAVCALQLARTAPEPCQIIVVEPRPTLGAGVAYGSQDPAHRINVPAARMIIYPDAPRAFDDWLRAGNELAADPQALWTDGQAYPRRAVFGRYVAELLAREAGAGRQVTISHHRDHASAIDRHDAGFTVTLGDGARIAADIVVIATSHPPPCPPEIVTRALGQDPRLIANPWRPDALDRIGPDDRVLIVGTGLTMADVVASLSQRGHRGRITAFSRRGQLSRGHAAYGDTPCWFRDNPAPATAIALLRQIRARIASGAEVGIPWQAVIDDVRANGTKLWSGLDVTQRRRLLRHLRCYWDVHRYRIAPQVAAAIAARRADGSLSVHAASLQTLTRESSRIAATLRLSYNAAGTVLPVEVDHVIVTTGPDHRTAIASNPALASLAAQGIIRADPYGLGLDVTEESEAIGADGRVDPSLRVAGPLARARFGELMGLPQVTGHALAVADKVTAMLSRNPRE